jgi:hypothetical protein
VQQSDYLLREIEKIGLFLRMLFDKITHREIRAQEAIDMLRQEIGFDMDRFLSLEGSEIESFILRQNGFQGSNIELLGDLLKVLGERSEPRLKTICLEKALKIYVICNSSEKTFSMNREEKINDILTNLKKQEELK